MMKSLSRKPFFQRALLLFIVGIAIGDAHGETGVLFDIEVGHGSFTKLTFGDHAVPLTPVQAGFAIRDFKAGADVALGAGRVTNQGGSPVFTAEGGDLSIEATFTKDPDGFIRVSGLVKNKRNDDRALIVSYSLPLDGRDATYEDEPGRSFKAGTKSLGTVYPLSAESGSDWGVSLAIPPSSPRCFGTTSSVDRIGLEFYLGLSAKTRAFPNEAAFEFVIFPATPGWGFRSALAQYYKHYPDFYTRRFEGSGFWNWNDKSDGIEPALGLYKIHGVTHAAPFEKDAGFRQQLERDKKYGVLSFDYTMVGQRELTGLPAVPADYAKSMDVFHEFQKGWADEDAAGGVGPLHKKYEANWRNDHMPGLIQRCVCTDEQGQYKLDARSTAWGSNSLTFIMNPNPALSGDGGGESVGSMTLKKAAEWFASEPADGIMVDSLGNHWPAILNYRQDHFAYAKYPLTFDTSGRVALHNNISHYEFLEALRALAVTDKKLVFGNAIIRYESPGSVSAEGNENYNGSDTGRWFSGALLDAAGREIESVMERRQLEFFRASMGPKLYTAVLYQWTDPGQVRIQMNRALVYDVFAGPNRWFGNKISYLTAKDGYYRDKDLLEWFIKNARLLYDAGWQPVTYARAGDPDVVCERYGAGNTFYFAVANFGKNAVDSNLSVDLKALKMSANTGEMCNFTEVAHGGKVKYVTEGDTSTVTLSLAPNETQILKLSRAW